MRWRQSAFASVVLLFEMAKRLRFTPTPEVLEELEALAWAFQPELSDLLGEGGALEGFTYAEAAGAAAGAGGPSPLADPAKSERRAALRAREHAEGAPPRPVLYHVTCRTVQSRMLLRPGPELDSLLVGCLARAQEAAPAVKACAYDFQSNHYHLLLISPDAPTLSHFMNVFQSTAAKEVNRTHDWRDQVWSRRYDSFIVSPEPRVQLERLRYIVAQGCDNNLVDSPLEWPGACSHRCLVDGDASVQGAWIDRTELYERRRSGEPELEAADVTTANTLHLAKLPAFDHLSDAEYRDLMQRLVAGVEKQTRERHQAERTRPLGVQGVLRVHPHQRPKKTKRSPRPWFHATRESFKVLKRAYKAFLDAYLRAAALLRQGHRDVAFPEGCFPSRLPVSLPLPSARARAPG